VKPGVDIPHAENQSFYSKVARIANPITIVEFSEHLNGKNGLTAKN
jgi:hypothetical protein